MEKKYKMARVYGYLVCLVTVITVIINIAGIVNSILDLQDPLHAGFYPGNAPSLASYNNYKMDILRSEKTATNYTPDETTLKQMYESARADKIQNVQHDGYKSITVNGVLIVFCIILFIIHWTWMRRLDKTDVEIQGN